MVWLLVRFLIGVGSIGGLAYWAKRRIGGAAGLRRLNGLRIVSRVAVAKGATVVRVATGEKDLLLGCTAQGITSLAELPPSPEAIPVAEETFVQAGLVARLQSTWSGTTRRCLPEASGDRSFASTLRSAVRGRAGSS